MAIVHALQLEGQSIWAVLAKCVLRSAQTANCELLIKTVTIAIRFSDPNFQKDYGLTL